MRQQAIRGRRPRARARLAKAPRQTTWIHDALGFACVAAFWLALFAAAGAWAAGVDSWPMWATGAR